MERLQIAGLSAIAALFLVVGNSLPSDEEAIAAEPSPAEQLDQEQSCAPPEWYCATFTDVCEVSAFCEGEDCYAYNKGAEIRVMSLGEPEDRFSADWLAQHPGSATLTPLGLACELTPIKASFTKVEIPATHCIAALATKKHYYVEFFASNPVSGCHGWVECQCY